MTRELCNQCGGVFEPASAVVAILRCTDCSREVPREPGMREPSCPRGCMTWRECDEPGPDCSATPSRERYGIGVCVTGVCSEPCGMDGGCAR